MSKLSEPKILTIVQEVATAVMAGEFSTLSRDIEKVHQKQYSLRGTTTFIFRGRTYGQRIQGVSVPQLDPSLRPLMADTVARSDELMKVHRGFKSYITDALHKFSNLEDLKLVIPAYIIEHFEPYAPDLTGPRKSAEAIKEFLSQHQFDLNKMNLWRASKLLLS